MIRNLGRVLIAAAAVCGLALGQSATVSEKPTKVSGSEQQAKLIKKVQPAYPAEAKAAGLEGTVRLEVVIAKDGTIKDITVLSGPEQFRTVTLDAVRQWLWEPTKINGKPVEVMTNVDVNFKLK